jgi:hypothetical protein
VKRLLLIGAVVTFAASAAEPPPHPPSQALDWPSSLDREPSKGIALGAFRVQFETTTLRDVQRAAFVGAIAQSGDAGEHMLWLCYTIKGPEVAERLWIISDGEMGGDTHAVTAIAARRLSRAAPTQGCPELPTAMQPVSLDANVWLGISDAQLEKELGPSHSVGPWRSYRYQTKVPGQCEGGYDMTNWLATKLRDGYITSLYAGQVTSC